jgi:hypothetical protein
MPPERVLDVAIIGGGIAGVVHLHYARQAGLDALIFERQDGVGGLWRELPAWQDIQISPADWALGDLPLAGPMQPQILANIEAWVERFALADGIRLASPVRRARHTGTCWEFETPQGVVRSRHLVAATGGHNLPVIPEVQRRNATVRERHANALHEPAELAGRDVVVVGGGASAFDLLDQCLEHHARRIVWVYRGLRWFTPTRKPKAIAGSVRPYAKMQASGMTAEKQNAAIRADMQSRYQKFGIQAIQPPQPIDVLHDQLIPGRSRMLANFQAFERHPGSVLAIEGQQVLLSNGTRLDADLLLWGTGYAIDLGYFEDPRLSSIRGVNELGARCGCIFRSLDAPDLYFPGVGLDGIGAAPWANVLMARSIMSHIRGTARLDRVPVGHKINHFEIARYLAQRDPGSYTEARGWDFYRDLALNTPDDEPYPIP